MARVIEPPWDELDRLPTPLEDGERQALLAFDRKLPEQWEIYVQPYLNGLRPDIVVLNPEVGVAVFEVKDWNLAHYRVRRNRGRETLMTHDEDGNEVPCEGRNPINKILLYRRELFELYCPRLDDKAGLAVITAGLLFPMSPSSEVERVFGPLRRANEQMSKWPRYYPMAGREQVASGDVAAIFPESLRTTSSFMTEDTAQDLRGWLREPYFGRRQRQPLTLDRQQRELSTTRTETGYRRIKGAAGSGKSVVLAARASELAAEGKSVLVVTFNITLLNYLRDLAVRHVARRQVVRRRIEFLHFHYWCRRVCSETGHLAEYQGLWREARSDDDELDSQPVLNERLASLVQRIYETHAGLDVVPRYDAVLVDEGQDFRLSWWQTLRLALVEGGEMVLAADKTQDVYGTAAGWTEAAMVNAGFRGPWAELKVAYRLPRAVVPYVARFAEEFLSDVEVDIPAPRQTEMAISPVELRWVHVRHGSDMLRACDSELSRMAERLRVDTAVADIIFLSGKELGRQFVDAQREKGIRMRHTFDDDAGRSRRQKRAFFQGDASIKATTVHSFKGWEARQLIVCVRSIEQGGESAVLYTALTRLLDHEHGSCLTVVSSCRALREYGTSWPDYLEV